MIILLGGSGYVGTAFQQLFRSQGIKFINLSRAELDYSDTATLTAFLREQRPEFLINAAGYTGKPNVDACELDKANCLFGNAVLPARIAEACAAVDLPWGHVSSGCIYTGARADGSGFTEEDAPNFTFRQDNCSFYSGTKALGEEVLEKYDNVFIWRLRIPFNHEDSPRNYLSKLMRYAKLLEADNSISQLDEFVRACLDCHRKQVPYGIYNVTNPGAVTTSQVVQWIQEELKPERDFHFFDTEENFMATAAKTPRSNCVLDSTKLAEAGISLTPVEQAVRTALKNGSWKESLSV